MNEREWDYISKVDFHKLKNLDFLDELDENYFLTEFLPRYAKTTKSYTKGIILFREGHLTYELTYLDNTYSLELDKAGNLVVDSDFYQEIYRGEITNILVISLKASRLRNKKKLTLEWFAVDRTYETIERHTTLVNVEIALDITNQYDINSNRL